MLIYLCIETVTFEYIKQQNYSVAVYFDDFSAPFTFKNEFSSLESSFSGLKFFFVDKKDPANVEVFKLPEFAQIPQIFVLSIQDGSAEKLDYPLTNSRLKMYLQLKTTEASPNLVQVSEYIENVTTIFITPTCEHCVTILGFMSRFSTVINETISIIYCEQLPDICEKLKIYESGVIMRNDKYLKVTSVADLVEPQWEEWKGQSVRAIRNYMEHSLRLRIRELEEAVVKLELKLSSKDEL
ncbi:hypothetical protein SS50377_23830 [Spironucleus salmonicida]|uniref:Thioredoxin domain-containing protein n=1 Tax=Spironucleus salmonicida TaxID=348837 RepID=V6LHV0_9EUKA|nr:hypothetical protein SS50377_23830 [Spironucleus salmonicida]|eukprot:EST44132.1 Hypothetical protein SS50377_16033 [Spironucleus salmonicida]